MSRHRYLVCIVTLLSASVAGIGADPGQDRKPTTANGTTLALVWRIPRRNICGTVSGTASRIIG
jgi:hypothetical protein